MTKSVEKILCKTPTAGKSPTRIPKWKYNIIRDAIIDILQKEEAVFFTDLPDKVSTKINNEDRENIGSMAWHVTTVKLHMETEGEIQRLIGKGRQRLSLT